METKMTYQDYITEHERLDKWAQEQGFDVLRSEPLSEEQWQENEDNRVERERLFSEPITSTDQVRVLLDRGFNIEGPDTATVWRVIDFLLSKETA